MSLLANFLVSKAYNPDEARGAKGRWTSEGAVRVPSAPFRMSDTEHKVLAAYRSGKSHKAIAQELGLSKSSVKTYLVHATEKDRLRILSDKEKPTAQTTLRQARRSTNPVTNVRQGKWK